MAALSDPGGALLDFAWAGAALEGESGDAFVARVHAGGAVLAVIDGLGHGPHAAAAARRASAIVNAERELGVEELFRRCHEGLVETRGAVMSLASYDHSRSSLEWAGVGNVEGVLLRAVVMPGFADMELAARGGVLGFRMPELRVSSLRVARRDVLILATDGIRGEFWREVNRHAAPQAIADFVLSRFGRRDDDALVLVARYLEAAS
ncbi:MAG: serine/threonine-protein phosphatase [Myxococcota bacterium]|nr:serine/threonine-protein phosphatase [Myxococcota bacterium]